MREIKFRAWDTEGKVMCDVITLNKSQGSDWHEYTVFWDGHYYNRPAEKVELMQYTGLKDSQNREVYEGDIVRYKHDFYENLVITDVVDLSRPRFWLKNEQLGFEGEGLVDQKRTEIIGNIYENKELLSSITGNIYQACFKNKD